MYQLTQGVTLPLLPPTEDICVLVFNPKVSELFTSASLSAFNPNSNTEELVSLFNHTCQTVLDSAAPYCDKQSKIAAQP